MPSGSPLQDARGHARRARRRRPLDNPECTAKLQEALTAFERIWVLRGLRMMPLTPLPPMLRPGRMPRCPWPHPMPMQLRQVTPATLPPLPPRSLVTSPCPQSAPTSPVPLPPLPRVKVLQEGALMGLPKLLDEGVGSAHAGTGQGR